MSTDSGTPDGDPAPGSAVRPPETLWRRLRRDRVAVAALAVVAVAVLVAVAAPAIVALAGVPGPGVQDASRLDSFGQPTGPSAADPLGVDARGRDVLARVVYGARVSLAIAFVATAIAAVVGVVVGGLAGYYRGWVDALLSRATEVVLAFPVLLLAVGIGVACSGQEGCAAGLIEPGFGLVVFIIALTTWPAMARIVRGQVLSLREQPFVEAARGSGASDLHVLRHEILPNLVAPVVVYATVLIPQNILYEAALAFLGVGVDSRTASWGQMLAEATKVFDTAWWFMAFPGLALLACVLAFNLLGDGLRDALDPRTTRAGVPR